MSKKERVKMVKAMEYIARHMNDEELFTGWLVHGVADGDVTYGDLTQNGVTDLAYYLEDEHLSSLMLLFLNMMTDALNSGGLLCDGIISGDREYEVSS